MTGKEQKARGAHAANISIVCQYCGRGGGVLWRVIHLGVIAKEGEYKMYYWEYLWNIFLIYMHRPKSKNIIEPCIEKFKHHIWAIRLIRMIEWIISVTLLLKSQRLVRKGVYICNKIEIICLKLEFTTMNCKDYIIYKIYVSL